MLNFILGGAGTGKSYFLMQKIREYHNEQKIFFIVPEQFSFENDKKLYEFLGAEKFNEILSLSFTSLSKEIFEKFGGKSGEYADDVQKFILMYKTIRELSEKKSFKYFDRQSSKADFTGEALKIITEFRQCGIMSDKLINMISAENSDYNEKITDLAMIYSVYNNSLEVCGLKDSLTDISESAAIADINDYFSGSIVFFDEFESFTGDEYEMIDTIISQAKEVYIALRLENIGQNEYSIFDSVEKTWKSFYQTAKKYNIKINTVNLENLKRYQHHDLAFLNKNIMRNNSSKFEHSENINITECRDLYEEADHICSHINNLVRNNGYKYSDIAVISRQLEEYTYIFEAAFKKYNIPYFSDIKKSAFHTSLMQLVTSVVDIISESKPDTEMILKYIKTRLNNMSIDEISAIENYCFEWDITGEQWFKPFTADIEKNPGIEETRKKITEPLVNLRRKCQGENCREICRNLYKFLEETHVPEQVSRLINHLNETGLEYQAKEQKRIWDMMIKFLDSISDIGGEVSLKEFRELFTAVLKQITYSTPPQTLDGVRIAHTETARLESPKAVFIAGVNEGFFPAAGKPGGLLNEKDRIKFENAGFHLSRSADEIISDEKLAVYKALTYASDKLYISYPLNDNMGGTRYPASVIKQIINMFGNDIFHLACEENILFYSSTPQAAYFNYVQNFGNKNQDTASLRTVLKQNPYYSSRIDYLEEAAAGRDFKIENKELVKQMYSQRLNISATGFEEFNLCRFKFFCNTGLKLRAKRKREIGSLEQGNLVHQCMEAVVGSCSSKAEFDSLTEDKISKIINECTESYLNDNMGGNAVKTPRLESNIINIRENILQIILHLQNELRQSQFRPVAFEFNINENNLPVLKADNGIEIFLRGVIDRVDIYEENGEKYIRVIDYKTGKLGKKTFSVSSLLYGINMQMLIYLFAVTGINGKYKDYIPAGVLYMPSGEIACGRDRDDSGSIEDYLNSHCKMNGVVLKERTVLKAMEEDIQGIYIPAKLLKDDGGTGEVLLNKRSSSCLTSAQFKNLREYTKKLMLNICEELYSGNISADPLIMQDSAPCDYCDYWSVCGNVPCEKFHNADKNAEEEMMKILSEQKNEREE
ncbi:PD-(D/E)XK nuclease family protein [Porcipelethomonas sp.]|uniref:PD-(D/E)XK nuclease family protein n=1 Tax=Porcipelethomonas sp. TaxID=2981675 RepID=UPI003EF9853C